MRNNFEQELAGNYTREIANLTNNLMILGDTDAHIVVQTVMYGMCAYAKAVKSKETPIAVVIDDYAGNTLLALKVEFFAGTEDNPEGSWNPVWTFDEADIENCTKYKMSESKANQFVIDCGKQSFGMNFATPASIYVSALAFGKVLRNYLDVNAKEGEPFEVELPDHFVASVTIIDGAQVLEFVAQEEVNNLTKDDDKLQA